MIYRVLVSNALLAIFEKDGPSSMAMQNERKRLYNLDPQKLGDEYKAKTGLDPHSLTPSKAA